MALQTETASEVLAQICLAFAAKHNRPLTNEDLFLDPQPEQENEDGYIAPDEIVDETEEDYMGMMDEEQEAQFNE